MTIVQVKEEAERIRREVDDMVHKFKRLTGCDIRINASTRVDFVDVDVDIINNAAYRRINNNG